MSFSLYIHIPYCHAKCPYCDFNSHAAASWPEADYTRALMAEMAYRAHEAPWHGEKLRTIFFGGGTPSLFAPASIATIIATAERHFGIESDAEITLEANPGTVDLGKLRGFRTAGVNRISFGAQSFNPATLKFLGRIHTADETRTAARLAHEAGFERLNLDLIFAVPGETIADLEHDIEEITALRPDHVSAYNLTFEEGTVFHTEMRRGRITPLPNDDQAAQYVLVRNELPRRGFPMYEISNYASPGHEARHNLTYWQAESYLGIGAGAHSFARDGAGGRRWWDERMPARYIAAALNDRAEAGHEMIDAATAASEFVFLHLRLMAGFSLADFQRRFGQTLDDRFGGVAQRLITDGLLLRDDDRVRLSDRGLELADAVFAEFL
jgi:oxygen-independent coproporphyrinogen-3 oxidase